MKKAILSTLVATAISTSAFADTIIFQKVYDVPGMDPEAITMAFGDKVMSKEDSTLEKISNALSGLSNAMQVKVNDESDAQRVGYNIKCSSWGVDQFFKGDIILQAKQDKYRLSVANLVSKAGYKIEDLSSGVKEDCKADIEEWAELKFQQVQKLAGNDW